MSGPTCHTCGQYLEALDDHDEKACEIEHRRRIYTAGAARARAEPAAAKTGKEATDG